MSVILLSDPSGPRNSDEHRAFELSAGGTATRLRLTPPEGQEAIPPKPEPPRATSTSTTPAKKPEEPQRETPSSTYLPASG